jgi:protein involved in polysaccharide export with SLBB domain
MSCLFLIAAAGVVLCGSAAAQTTNDVGTGPTIPGLMNDQSNTGQAANTSNTSGNDQSSGTTAANQSGMPTSTANGTSMTVDQIIEILREQPSILTTVKDEVARQAGVDPISISDDDLYSRIQNDPVLRAQIAAQLNKLGYNANEDLTGKRSTNNPVNLPETRKQATKGTTPPEDEDVPQSIQRPNPYSNLTSVHDLYTQIPSAGGKLQRFGSKTFILGTGNANELPLDLPVGPDYVLGPGDDIVVNMWGGRSERLNLTIDRQGQIALPEAGTITLDRLTIAEAQSAIQKALGTQFQNEHVEISLGRLRTVRVYVVGDVQRPGAYDVSSMSTPLSALYAAGGPTSRGSLRVIRHLRGKEMIREIDLYDFLLHGVRSDSDRLLPGDTILVPPVGPQISVEGMVHRPAIYELDGEQSLNQILDLAGGILISADIKQINIARVEANERRTMISLDLPDNSAEQKRKLADFHVRDGDGIVVSQILPFNQQAVYLEGHVFRPGKYAYRDGMTINDLLHSYQDVMPEPADHLELVRLQPPDYRPQTISLNLPDIMIGNNPILLRPFDLVRVFSRYEIDPPRVSIEGEVLRPGQYPMSQGLTVAGLIQMAGGFRRSAYIEEADLSSYVVDGESVRLNHTSVALKPALEGDKGADVVLKAGDVVSVRQLSGWHDIGSTVVISGEVEHPGSYGIEQGERLSSVLKRAGGFRPTAYPGAAVLERIQVRELSEQAHAEMIRRIETTPINFQAGTLSPQEQTTLLQSLEMQRQHVLATLRSHPASGRQVVNISPDISKWANTAADIEMRAGDTLVIPKTPNFVMVTGQVYNATAISYVPGRTVSWYLEKAGGATPSGNKGDIYVLRADGSVVGHSNSWISGSVMDLRMRQGDAIVVPEKIIGGSQVWRNLIAVAQIMSSVAITGAIAGAW